MLRPLRRYRASGAPTRGRAPVAVTAAQLRPTVAVVGESGGFDGGTAAARQRQAARRRARLPPQLRRGVTAPTSHNGAHYAFVHPQPRPAKTRSASGGSHVGASGRNAALKQNGVLFPWRCPAAAAFSVMPATTGRNIAAALCCPQAPNRLRRSGDVPPVAPRPPGAGRVGRPSTSSGLHGRRPRRTVFEDKGRAPCSPVVT
jgi:hypothetical protein